MKDVSIILPSIRPKNLLKFYEFVLKACKKHSFQIVIPSPYLIPEELMRTGNVTFLHTYANPTISFQIGALLANSKFIYNTTDDGLIQEDAIDTAIDLFNNLGRKDAVNMIYKEGVLNADTLELIGEGKSNHPIQYWDAYYHPDLRLPGIRPDWKICPHFFMHLEYFIELGGFDCIFEYNNHALHDLAFRLQSSGGKVFNLPICAFHCSHLPETTGDHAPVHYAQTGPDLQNFNEIYQYRDAALLRIKLQYDNWKKYPMIWERRFNKDNLKV